MSICSVDHADIGLTVLAVVLSPEGTQARFTLRHFRGHHTVVSASVGLIILLFTTGQLSWCSNLMQSSHAFELRITSSIVRSSLPSHYAWPSPTFRAPLLWWLQMLEEEIRSNRSSRGRQASASIWQMPLQDQPRNGLKALTMQRRRRAGLR